MQRIRPLTLLSIGLIVLIAILLLVFANMNREFQRKLDQRPVLAACLEAGGTMEQCKEEEAAFNAASEGIDGPAGETPVNE